MAADKLEARRFAELQPLAGKVHELALADKLLHNPDRMSAGLQDRVALLHDLAGRGPEGVAGGVAELVIFLTVTALSLWCSSIAESKLLISAWFLILPRQRPDYRLHIAGFHDAELTGSGAVFRK